MLICGRHAASRTAAVPLSTSPSRFLHPVLRRREPAGRTRAPTMATATSRRFIMSREAVS